MMGSLFLKECRQSIWNLTYVIILACAVLFFLTQMSESVGMAEPNPEFSGRREIYSSEPEDIIQYGINKLGYSLLSDNFTTYPVGFMKIVRLNAGQLEEVTELFCELIGIDRSEYEVYMEQVRADLPEGDINGVSYGSAAESLSDERFREIMSRLDRILGGGSDFAEDNLKQVRKQVTLENDLENYQEELQNYEDFLYRDKVSGGNARMFCDYMGIMMGILPIFLVVNRCLRDKRSQISQVIYTKQISGTVILVSRFLAMVTAMLVPVLIMGLAVQLECAYFASGISVSSDWLAFPKYILLWILPEIMVCTAVGILLTEWTESPIAILVQAVWWYGSIFTSGRMLIGSIGFNLVPRFNSKSYYRVFVENLPDLIRNRIFYTILSLALLALGIYVFEQKRRGKIHGKSIRRKASGIGA